jgi:hypothetical protein
MKKIKLLTAVFLITAFSSNAQYKGMINLGGCVGFSTESIEVPESKITTFSLLPILHYYMAANLALGMGIGYDMTKTKTETPILPSGTYVETVTESYFWAYPHVRWHGKVTERVSCFLDAGPNMQFGSYEQEEKDPDTSTVVKDKFTTIGLLAKPGIYWQIKKTAGISFHYGALEYTSTTWDPEVGDKTTDSFFGLKLNGKYIRVGVYYTFGGGNEM